MTMRVVRVRLSASESLINGHITAVECEEYGLPLPGICDCEGETNGCGRPRRFRATRAAVFDATAAFSCYDDASRSAAQQIIFYYTYSLKRKSRTCNVLQHTVYHKKITKMCEPRIKYALYEIWHCIKCRNDTLRGRILAISADR